MFTSVGLSIALKALTTLDASSLAADPGGSHSFRKFKEPMSPILLRSEMKCQLQGRSLEIAVCNVRII